MKSKLVLCFLLAFSLVGSVLAQEEGSVGSTHLLVPLSARTAALGQSLTSGVSGMNVIESLQSNPATLAANTGTQALFSRMNYVADIGVNYFGVAQNFGNNTLAFTINTWDFGDIPLQTEDSPDPGDLTWTATNFTAGLSYGRQFTDRIAAGATVKMVSEKIDNTNASTVAFDAGMSYIVGESGLRFGVALTNFGTKQSWGGPGLNRFAFNPDQPANTTRSNFLVEAEQFELPSALTFGAAYTASVSGDLNVTVLGNFRSNGFAPDQYTGGLELGYNDLFYVRGAYNMESDADVSFYTGLSYGAGLNLNLSGTQVSVDYGYRATEFFAAPQTITVGVKL